MHYILHFFATEYYSHSYLFVEYYQQILQRTRYTKLSYFPQIKGQIPYDKYIWSNRSLPHLILLILSVYLKSSTITQNYQKWSITYIFGSRWTYTTRSWNCIGMVLCEITFFLWILYICEIWSTHWRSTDDQLKTDY